MFRMGNRDASPLDQWPDPDVYIHYPGRELLSYIDARNTNRTWPGRPDGLLMERVTYAAMELMRREGVDVAMDIHGAETMFPVTNCIVAPEKSMRIATLAALTVKATEGFESHVEPSPARFRGLSHREIGDHSAALPFLLEAPIPFLDQPTGPKTERLLLDGRDDFLLGLAKKKKLFVPYDESGWPIEKRRSAPLLILEIPPVQKNSSAPSSGKNCRRRGLSATASAGFHDHGGAWRPGHHELKTIRGNDDAKYSWHPRLRGDRLTAA
jgi:hypothetical protein